MLRNTLIALAVVLTSSVIWADATVPTQDLVGARDPAFLKRYEGAFIVSYDDKAFDEFVLPLSRLEPDSDPKRRDAHNNKVFAPSESLNLEGHRVRLVYVVPQERSPLEVVRNYRDEVDSLGGRVLFECKRNDCGGDPGRASDGGGGEMSLAMVLRPQELIGDSPFSNGHCAQLDRIEDQRYLAAELPQQSAHVSVLAYTLKGGGFCKALAGRTIVVVDVLETKARERKMVAVDAPEMARSIAATGRIALYGILFDFDLATLKPESDPVLSEIGSLLKSNPKLKLLVVGHTDNAGNFDYNEDLSQRRAQAVVDALVSHYDVDRTRLRPVGVSFAAPVASNGTEEGRAQNRRVELVEY
jgi:OmpA-OmpF porin, OOP family